MNLRILTEFAASAKSWAELLQRISHPSGKHHTGRNPRQCSNQRARQGIPRLFYFCSHKIHRHRIKNGFRTPHHDGDQVAEEGVRAIFFEDVQSETGGGAGREHSYDGRCGYGQIAKGL